MSSRLRGQEAFISITVSDEFLQSVGLAGELAGSFTKVRDFSITPRIDQIEESYLGETFDDLDQQVHGFDFSFTVDELDASALQFLDLVVFKEQFNLAPPVVTVSVTYVYREGGVQPQTQIFSDCILKNAERSIGGRKEYIQNSFEGKAKQHTLAVG